MVTDTIWASIIGAVGIVLAGLITKAIKDKEIAMKVSEAADAAAKAAALETAKLQLQQYDDMQKDLKESRRQLREVNNRIDSVYRELSKWRNYADRLRGQLIKAGIVPVPFEEGVENGRNG